MEELKEISAKLDKIIELLNNIPSFQFDSAEKAVEFLQQIRQADDGLPDYARCNCNEYIPGGLTGGWFCPLHGHKF